jgi:hypothetical protein
MSVINKGFSWKRALAHLGDNLEKQGQQAAQSARQQAAAQAAWQRQLAMQQMENQREDARNRVMDERWQQTYGDSRADAQAARDYQNSMLQNTISNTAADNARQQQEFEWRKSQAEAASALQMKQAQDAITNSIAGRDAYNSTIAPAAQPAEVLPPTPPVDPEAYSGPPPPPFLSPAGASGGGGATGAAPLPQIANQPAARVSGPQPAAQQVIPPGLPGLPDMPSYAPFAPPKMPDTVDTPEEYNSFMEQVKSAKKEHDASYKRDMDIYNAQVDRYKLMQSQKSDEEKPTKLTAEEAKFGISLAEDPLVKVERRSYEAMLLAVNEQLIDDPENKKLLEKKGKIIENLKAMPQRPSGPEAFKATRSYQTGEPMPESLGPPTQMPDGTIWQLNQTTGRVVPVQQ